MNEVVIYVVGTLVVLGGGFFILKGMKKGVKREKKLQEDRKNNEHN